MTIMSGIETTFLKSETVTPSETARVLIGRDTKTSSPLNSSREDAPHLVDL
jgi:hypothetical protein